MTWDRDTVIDALDKVGDSAMLIAEHARGRLAQVATIVGLTLKGASSALKRDPALGLDDILQRIRGPRVLTGWPEAVDTAHDTPKAKRRAKGHDEDK